MVPLIEVSLSGVMDATVHRCPECGFRQVRPRLGRHELARLYSNDYFDAASEVGFRDYHRQQQRAEREGYFLARRLRRIAPAGRLLEVGCALGFLMEAAARFSGWTVAGVDVSPFAAWFARRRYDLDVRCATLEEAAFDGESFDFVVAKDLLEHVLAPRDLMGEVHRILRPGGHVWLVTPNGEANIRPLQGIARRLRDARDGERLPRLDQGHLSFFHLANLERLFQECEFDVVDARSIDLKRGLRALGVVPKKRKDFNTGPRGNHREAAATAAPRSGATDSPGTAPADEARMGELYDRVDEAMTRSRRAGRSHPAYFWFREVQRRFDAVPARFEWGNDFEFLLRRR
jgi:SAM-dependent methyltransferase